MTSTSTKIEPGIRPLVDALNAIPGVETIGSCEGHIRWTGVFTKRPYVYFRAPNRLAEHIATFLHQDMAGRRPHLEQPWQIQGLFHPELGLCFHLMAEQPMRLILRRLRHQHSLRADLQGETWRDIENLAGVIRLYEFVQKPTQGSGAPNEVNQEGRSESQNGLPLGLSRLKFGVGMPTEGADLGQYADAFSAVDARHHPDISHSESPADEITVESLADLLVRTVFRSVATHGDQSHPRTVVAEAFAIASIRTVGLNPEQYGRSVAPRDFRRPT